MHNFAFSAIRLELSNLRVAQSQVTKKSLRIQDPLDTYVKVAMRLLWQYNSTDCTVHDSVCKSSFLWKWSMYAKVQHSCYNVAQHLHTHYRLCNFVCCFVLLHAFLQLFYMTLWGPRVWYNDNGVKWNRTQDVHTKFVLVFRLKVNIQYMLQTICTWAH